MTSRSKPTIQMELRNGALSPVTRYDAEIMETYSQGQVFDIKSVSQRSNPHHKLYWTILNHVVKATGAWPTSAHLHNEVKFLTGYYKSIINQSTGGVFCVVDSISFESMDQKEFSIFFDAVMEKLSDKLGIDPMELLE
tara:strand:- start:281 stop:694 length:414 start_codon:yes stop_codon:yes gene_type:complete